MDAQIRRHPEWIQFERTINMVENNGMGKMWMFDCWEEVHDERRVSRQPKKNHRKNILHYSRNMPDDSQGQRLLLRQQSATEFLLVGFYANTVEDYELWKKHRYQLRNQHEQAIKAKKKQKQTRQVYNVDGTSEGMRWHANFGTKPFVVTR